MPSVASASARRLPRKRKVDGDDEDLVNARFVKKKLQKKSGGTVRSVSKFITVPTNKKEAVETITKKEQTITTLRAEKKALEDEVATSVRDHEITDRFCYLLLKELQATGGHLQRAYNKFRGEIDNPDDIYSVSEWIKELDVDGIDADKLAEGYDPTA